MCKLISTVWFLIPCKCDNSFKSVSSVPSTANIQMFRAKRHDLPETVKSGGNTRLVLAWNELLCMFIHALSVHSVIYEIKILKLRRTYVTVRATIKDLVVYGAWVVTPSLHSNLPIKILYFALMISCTIALMFGLITAILTSTVTAFIASAMA